MVILSQTRSWIIDEYDGAFPESEHVHDKEDVAIAISGGGARAFTGAIGYLSAFYHLELLHNVKYIMAFSGGSWATSVYTFSPIAPHELLGPVTKPEDITLEFLDTKAHENCIRTAFAEKNMITTTLTHMLDPFLNFEKAWANAIDKVLLEPAQINGEAYMALTEGQVDEYVTKYPNLYTPDDFITPRDTNNASFPIIGITLVAPEADDEFGPNGEDQYRILEATPLYVGEPMTKTLNYTAKKTKATHQVQVGGYVEPIAFDSVAPTHGSGFNNTYETSDGILDVEAPEEPFILKRILGG